MSTDLNLENGRRYAAMKSLCDDILKVILNNKNLNEHDGFDSADRVAVVAGALASIHTMLAIPNKKVLDGLCVTREERVEVLNYSLLQVIGSTVSCIEAQIYGTDLLEYANDIDIKSLQDVVGKIKSSFDDGENYDAQ